MPRRLLAAGFVLALAVAAGGGCRMCAHPYDYCGPTFDGQCGTLCDPSYRAGSILSGGATAYPAQLQDDGATLPYDDDGAVRPTPAEASPARGGTSRPGQWVAQTPHEAR